MDGKWREGKGRKNGRWWRKSIITDETRGDSLSYDKLFPRVAPEQKSLPIFFDTNSLHFFPADMIFYCEKNVISFTRLNSNPLSVSKSHVKIGHAVVDKVESGETSVNGTKENWSTLKVFYDILRPNLNNKQYYPPKKLICIFLWKI